MDNTEHIKREHEARLNEEKEARAILDLAAEEKRSVSAEEDERFDKLVASAEVRKARIAKLAKLDTDGAELAEQVRSRIGDQDDPESGAPDRKATKSGDTLIAETVRSMFDLKANGSEVPGEIAWDHDLGTAEVVRAISDFGNGTSLYVSDFSTRLAIYLRTVSPWVSLGTVITATNGRPMIFPNLSVDPTSYTNGEATAITAADPTLGTATATLTGYKALTLLSQESDEDEEIGLLAAISKTQGRSIGLKFGTDATAAVLSGGTNGGTAGGLGGVGTGTATFFGYEDLIDLKFGIAAPYRIGGVGAWVMSNAAIKKVRKFRDANGAYFFQAASNPQTADSFDGDPIYEDPGLAAPASATKSVVYGDPSAFMVKQMPLRVAVSTEYLFNTDQIALKSVWRAGGALPDAAALRFLVSANA